MVWQNNSVFVLIFDIHNEKVSDAQLRPYWDELVAHF